MDTGASFQRKKKYREPGSTSESKSFVGQKLLLLKLGEIILLNLHYKASIMAAIRQGVRRMTTLAGQALKDAIAAEEKHARSMFTTQSDVYFSFES